VTEADYKIQFSTTVFKAGAYTFVVRTQATLRTSWRSKARG